MQATNLIDEFNRVLATIDGCIVNIVNDKLTLAVMIKNNVLDNLGFTAVFDTSLWYDLHKKMDFLRD